VLAPDLDERDFFGPEQATNTPDGRIERTRRALDIEQQGFVGYGRNDRFNRGRLRLRRSRSRKLLLRHTYTPDWKVGVCRLLEFR
jgi:hypothetical protein